MRDAVLDDFSSLTASKPEKSLTVGLRKKAGRNNMGRVTVRHRGGGHKRLYRIIDFARSAKEPATVLTIEYDPNRSAYIALVRYKSGKKAYIIAPNNVRPGDILLSGENSPVKPGNVRPLKRMPTGTLVHSIEITPGGGGKLVRSAGCSARVMAHEGKYTLLAFPSGERRNILSACLATVGTVTNSEHRGKNLGKAGRRRNLGWRPTVRGSAMAPNAHPHGGGEGRAKIGLKHPKTPTGKAALGVRTRGKKASDRLIISRRYDNRK